MTMACKGSADIRAKGNLAMFRWRITDVLPQIDVPMLVLAGRKDIVTLPSASTLIADVAPHADLFLVQGAGLMRFMETRSGLQRADRGLRGPGVRRAAPGGCCRGRSARRDSLSPGARPLS